MQPMTDDGAGAMDQHVSADGPRSPKAQDAYLLLHQAIREGHYPAGARLKEVDLASKLGMSRTPIREAIRQLQRDGVVTVVPHRGAVVRVLSEQEIDDTYSLRAVLEGYCASRAAIRMEPAELRELEAIHAEFEPLTRHGQGSYSDADIDDAIRLNRAFHTAIANGSKNSRITDVMRNATEVPLHMKQLYWRSEQARAGARVHHREILEALLARDAVRADAVMRTHVYAVRDYFMRQHRAGEIQRLDTGSPAANPSSEPEARDTSIGSEGRGA
jgi:DNA-binding GntR family transcriptional regulator